MINNCLSKGAPCGVYDTSGTLLLSLLIEKLPQIALEAIEQFHHVDRAFRKHFYYLGSLERDPKFLGEKIPEKKKDRKEQRQRQKAALEAMRCDDSIKIDVKVRGTMKCYARTPLEVSVVGMQITFFPMCLSID